MDEPEEELEWSDAEGAAVKEDVEIGRRLALTNMDWDNLTAVDILSLFSSLCKGEMVVTRVDIYPSLYGIEQMKNDALYGPPKDLFDANEKPSKKAKKVEPEF